MEPEKRAISNNQKVQAIAALMHFKLDKNKDKPCPIMNPDGTGRSWAKCDVSWLLMRLREEANEIEKALLNEGPAEVAKECADVCNFAMMIADNAGGLMISPASQTIEAYIRRRIEQLNKADAAFCKDRWDMSKPAQERNLYREESNSVTRGRQELESVLKVMGLPRFVDPNKTTLVPSKQDIEDSMPKPLGNLQPMKERCPELSIVAESEYCQNCGVLKANHF